MRIACTNCRQPYPLRGAPYRCPNCGGIFDYSSPFAYDPIAIELDLPGIWRYRHAFGLSPDVEPLSLGEGNTPTVWAPAFGRQVAFKCEFLNPSGSFKDRGSATLTGFLRSRGVTEALEDSSGNAGASFAAYSARAGITTRVFVPESTSGPKRKQIEMYGAEVIAVPGQRSNAAEALKEVLADRGDQVAYASHAYLPFNLPGYATLAYELWLDLGSVPGSVVLPVGQGGLLLGVWRGFQAMKEGRLDRSPAAHDRSTGKSLRAIMGVSALWTFGTRLGCGSAYPGGGHPGTPAGARRCCAAGGCRIWWRLPGCRRARDPARSRRLSPPWNVRRANFSGGMGRSGTSEPGTARSDCGRAYRLRPQGFGLCLVHPDRSCRWIPSVSLLVTFWKSV